ncbi:hypothetical protein NO758_03083 [Planktothrix agardhii]|nr:hypothetical protein NO758_03083 [Planktothrix agardhii]
MLGCKLYDLTPPDYSAVETASTQTKPAVAGCEPLDFSSVREGGHRLYSREFHSPDTSSYFMLS